MGRPRASFDGQDLYLDVFAKAAALMDSLIHNHPFVEGNKRTGIACVALFLRRNGYQLTASNGEVEKLALQSAGVQENVEQIAARLRANSEAF